METVEPRGEAVVGTVEPQNGRTVEPQNRGTVEQQNGGTVEPQNGAVVGTVWPRMETVGVVGLQLALLDQYLVVEPRLDAEKESAEDRGMENTCAGVDVVVGSWLVPTCVHSIHFQPLL